MNSTSFVRKTKRLHSSQNCAVYIGYMDTPNQMKQTALLTELNLFLTLAVEATVREM